MFMAPSFEYDWLKSQNEMSVLSSGYQNKFYPIKVAASFLKSRMLGTKKFS